MHVSKASAPAVALLRESARRFDASPSLRRAARRCARRGFAGGAEWMALALAGIRGSAVRNPGTGAVRLGLVKYGAAALAAAAVAAIALAARRLELLPLAVAAFYAVESGSAFVFPAFADGAARPWAESRALVAAAGGRWAVAGRIAVIALVMLLGGFAGRGFLRSWCVGCLAVVLWYEDLRR